MLTRAEGKRQARAIQRERDRAYRRQAKAKLAELRTALRAAKAARKGALRAAVAQCRAARVAQREQAKARRAALLEQLREAFRAERRAARDTCTTRKQTARATVADAIQRAQAQYTAERQYQADLKRIEQGNRLQRLEAKQASAKVRRDESDDEVRSNIPPGLVILFERVKRQIRGNLRQSRTDAFLKYAEEHPREALAAIDDETDRRIAEMQAREKTLARAVRKRRYTAAELAEVPF
jgi:hypothetical protein